MLPFLSAEVATELLKRIEEDKAAAEHRYTDRVARFYVMLALGCNQELTSTLLHPPLPTVPTPTGKCMMFLTFELLANCVLARRGSPVSSLQADTHKDHGVRYHSLPMRNKDLLRLQPDLNWGE